MTRGHAKDRRSLHVRLSHPLFLLGLNRRTRPGHLTLFFDGRLRRQGGTILQVPSALFSSIDGAADHKSPVSNQQPWIDESLQLLAVVDDALCDHVVVKDPAPILQEEISRLDSSSVCM